LRGFWSSVRTSFMNEAPARNNSNRLAQGHRCHLSIRREPEFYYWQQGSCRQQVPRGYWGVGGQAFTPLAQHPKPLGIQYAGKQTGWSSEQHPVPQSRPGLQIHIPLRHVPEPQETPHAPQFLGSAVKFEHLPLQQLLGGQQISPHQTWSLSQQCPIVQ
jgi:hypothetical protein